MINNFIKSVFNCSVGILLPSLLILTASASAQTRERKLLSLEGRWKFTIGDDVKWKEPKFDDSRWEEIRVPADWEEQGFNGYDGFGWYRRHFTCPPELKGKSLYLHAGSIDDADEIYLNGTIIGRTGSLPPEFQTAYDVQRIYPVPEELLRFNGDNVLSVRVYDAQLNGGITSGSIGLFLHESYYQPDIVLEGMWKFRTGNDDQWADKNYNDKQWDLIKVPAFWEPQGYPDYDGFAWYRKKFSLPSGLNGKELVLVLGKIDDKDVVYLNGREIGHVGNIQRSDVNERDYQTLRAYTIPKNVLQKENTVAVKVYDGYLDGGIYEGPVGIMTKEKYQKYRTMMRVQYQKEHKSFWELIFGW